MISGTNGGEVDAVTAQTLLQTLHSLYSHCCDTAAKVISLFYISKFIVSSVQCVSDDCGE